MSAPEALERAVRLLLEEGGIGKHPAWLAFLRIRDQLYEDPPQPENFRPDHELTTGQRVRRILEEKYAASQREAARYSSKTGYSSDLAPPVTPQP